MVNNNLEDEVLEFDDDTLPELPDDNPFDDMNAKKRPWLLIGVGAVAIILVAIVVLKLTVGGRDDSETIEIPIEQATNKPANDLTVGNDFVDDANKIVAVTENKPTDMPERVVDNRKAVTFDPDKPVVQRPKPRPIAEPVKTEEKPVTKPSVQTAQVVAPKKGVWAVQVGSFNARSAAESAQKRLWAQHKSLFAGRDFVILSAVLPNGSTTYRLRVVGFETNVQANGFCRNAQSDGVSCYVTK
jgi:cell division protein FtsN